MRTLTTIWINLRRTKDDNSLLSSSINQTLRMKNIPRSIISEAMSYPAYRELIDRLFVDGKTTGPDDSEAMLNYSHLNISRMRRLDKTTQLTEETLAQLSEIKQPIIWLTLTEGWCGDAAQVVPVLNHMANESEQLELKLLLRDQHLDIMDAFLTNGGRSIPKVIFLDAKTLEVLGSWGPRPAAAQQLIEEFKTNAPKIADLEERKAYEEEIKKQTQLWYAKDKTRSIQLEVVEALFNALATIPVEE